MKQIICSQFDFPFDCLQGQFAALCADAGMCGGPIPGGHPQQSEDSVWGMPKQPQYSDLPHIVLIRLISKCGIFQLLYFCYCVELSLIE